MSELFRLSWRRSDEGPNPSYILYNSAEDRAEARRATELEWIRFRQNLKRAIAALASGKLPQGEDPTDRGIQVLASSEPNRRAAVLAGGLPDTLLDACLRGKEVRIPFQRLPARQQQAFVGFLSSTTAELDRINGNRDRGSDLPNGHHATLLATPKVKPEEAGARFSLSSRNGSGRSATLLVGAYPLSPGSTHSSRATSLASDCSFRRRNQ